jgi:hypothetical protein
MATGSRAYRLTAASVCLALIALLIVAREASANTELGGAVGASYVLTNTEDEIFGCDTRLKERRVSAALMPEWRQRGRSLAGQLTVNASLPEGDYEPAVYESSGQASYVARHGHHETSITGAASYADELVLYGCTSALEQRLRRQREIRSGDIVPGSGVHRQSLQVQEAFGNTAEMTTVTYRSTRQQGDELDRRQELSLAFDKSWTRDLKGSIGLAGGQSTGSFDRFADVGASAGLEHRVSERLGWTGRQSFAVRDNGERTFGSAAGARYRLTRQSSAHTSIARVRYVGRSAASTTELESGVDYGTRWSTFAIAAHRIEIDDAAQSRGNWLSATVTRALTMSQRLSLEMTSGNPYPDQARELSSGRVSYDLRLFGRGGPGGDGGGAAAASGRRSRGPSDGGVGLSYGYSRLVDLAERAVVVRQWIASVAVTL